MTRGRMSISNDIRSNNVAVYTLFFLGVLAKGGGIFTLPELKRIYQENQTTKSIFYQTTNTKCFKYVERSSRSSARINFFRQNAIFTFFSTDQAIY